MKLTDDVEIPLLKYESFIGDKTDPRFISEFKVH
jgi:hypothetical protein